LRPLGLRDLAGADPRSREPRRLVVVGLDVAHGLILGLLAHQVRERGADGEHDLAQHVLDEQALLLDSEIRRLHAGATLRPYAYPLAHPDAVYELRERSGPEPLALRVPRADDHVAGRVRQHGVRIDPRRDALHLRLLDREPRSDDIEIAPQRD